MHWNGSRRSCRKATNSGPMFRSMRLAAFIRLGFSGIPYTGILKPIAFLQGWKKNKVRQTAELVPPNVQFAFHAVSLHEVRAPFFPTLMSGSKVHQVSFPGGYGNLGWIEHKESLHRSPLAWMIQQLGIDETTVLGYISQRSTHRLPLLGSPTREIALAIHYQAVEKGRKTGWQLLSNMLIPRFLFHQPWPKNRNKPRSPGSQFGAHSVYYGLDDDKYKKKVPTKNEKETRCQKTRSVKQSGIYHMRVFRFEILQTLSRGLKQHLRDLLHKDQLPIGTAVERSWQLRSSSPARLGLDLNIHSGKKCGLDIYVDPWGRILSFGLSTYDLERGVNPDTLHIRGYVYEVHVSGKGIGDSPLLLTSESTSNLVVLPSFQICSADLGQFLEDIGAKAQECTEWLVASAALV
ncbi:hypothetical protein BDZ45DRAFT_693563 [Acephala macrosclerotiorum]|nr:hypothetical protein BDZ45DRAFT_693563 [Acephala macrosclerotiorum]